MRFATFGIDLTLYDLDGMKLVRESTEIPIEADESAFGLQMVYKLLRRQVWGWNSMTPK